MRMCSFCQHPVHLLRAPINVAPWYSSEDTVVFLASNSQGDLFIRKTFSISAPSILSFDGVGTGSERTLLMTKLKFPMDGNTF